LLLGRKEGRESGLEKGFTEEERAAMKARARDLVRDARVRQGRQGRLLPQARGEVQVGVATFGFEGAANLDEGAMWPTAFALKELTAAEEARIAALARRAVS
jgi:hypothetical protein